jgi:hypothetical protein
VSNRTPEELAAAIGEAAVPVLKEELEVRRGKDELRNQIVEAIAICTKEGEPHLLDSTLAERDAKIDKDFSVDGYAVGELLPTTISKWITELLGGKF